MEFFVLKKSRYTFALFAFSLLLLPSFGTGVEWKNLDDMNRIGGRKVSEGYLRGKVVLVNRWGCDDSACRALLPRMEEIWQSFKSKPFVLLGGHCKGRGATDELKALVEKNKLTFPVYEDAGLAENEPEIKEIPYLYIVDETGKVRYKGKDERLATEQVVMMLTDMEAPKNAAMWEKFINFEKDVVPGRALLRLTEYRKKFPQEAKKYDEDYKRLKNDPEVQKLARLITFAKMAKDFDPKSKKTKGKVTKSRIESTVKVYEVLKESKNALVAQEAKNAIADLKWAAANL